MKHTVLIADDHPVFRRGLRDVLEDVGRFEIVAEVGDGRAALQSLRRLAPDVAVVDVSMPELDGLELLGELRGWESAPPVVVLTMYTSYARRALELGALGYVLKDNAVDELVAAVDAVLAGRRYVGDGVDHQLDVGDPLSELTEAERRVVALVGEVKTSREIAELLSVSVRTVQNHRANACSKLGLTGPKALLRFALALRDGEIE